MTPHPSRKKDGRPSAAHLVRSRRQLRSEQQRSRDSYYEFLRIAPMSLGLYVIRERGIDDQRPHREDEVYVVLRGKGRVRVGRTDSGVIEGSVIFVPALRPHHFHSITETLELLVVFAPAYTRDTSSDRTASPRRPHRAR
ncbi:MAG: cupin domain-containing protein [Thermoplasmata archaeon]